MSEAPAKTPKQEELLNTVQHPAQDGSVNSAKIGDFSLSNAELGKIVHLKTDATAEDWRENTIRDEEIIEATDKDEFDEEIIDRYGGRVAATIPGAMWLPKYQIEDEGFKKYLENTDNSMMQYYTDNTIAHISLLAHERTHYQHYQQNPGTADTPLMSLEFSDTTEQIANFNEYMTHAHIWKSAKKSGAKYIQLGDKQIKTDDILKYMPGLKEEVLRNGFDEKDPECRQRIAKISSEHWNKKRSEVYGLQAKTMAFQHKDFPLMGAIVNAREWKERKKQMVENLKTGDGATFSAPECLVYFEPSKKRIKTLATELSENHPDIPFVTNDDLLKLDKHMNKIGLKTDEEKEKYITEQMIYISKRDSKTDKDFEKLLLAASNQGNQQITYADGITVKYDKDKAVISKGDISLIADAKTLSGQDGNLKQELKSQKGKYPPDASTPEAAAMRAMNGVKMEVACNKRDKEPKEVKKQAPALQNTQQTYISPAQRNAER